MNKGAFIALFLIISACSKSQKPDYKLDQQSLIPLPANLTATDSHFNINEDTKVTVNSKGLNGLATGFAEQLSNASGIKINLEHAETAGDNTIFFGISPNVELGNEGYELIITEEGVEVLANGEEGIFRAIQTLTQMLPIAFEIGKKDTEAKWVLPGGKIKDIPNYAYRGSMLDVARHFYPVAEVKRYIDLIAAYKINILHLHLSDDQGWRIEIKSWPKLAIEGGKTQVGGKGGGYYTQEQYKDIVNYARKKFITVIPEIDMPGHTNAAMVAYPELYCTGKKPELYEGTEVGFSTLCTKNEITYQFINDVIKELAAMTPGPYIHIGGDESHSTPLNDYVPFINRVQDIVSSHNKIMIGWDEITNANLNSKSIAQFWAEAKFAQKAAENNNKLIFSPAKKAYLDMQYNKESKLGLHWAAYIEVDSSYNWSPSDYVNGVGKNDILGVEAPLWGETIKTFKDCEYLTFPRLLSIAEIGWTPKERRNWADYRKRLGMQGPRFTAKGVNYYPSKQIDWMK